MNCLVWNSIPTYGHTVVSPAPAPPYTFHARTHRRRGRRHCRRRFYHFLVICANDIHLDGLTAAVASVFVHFESFYTFGCLSVCHTQAHTETLALNYIVDGNTTVPMVAVCFFSYSTLQFNTLNKLSGIHRSQPPPFKPFIFRYPHHKQHIYRILKCLRCHSSFRRLPNLL